MVYKTGTEHTDLISRTGYEITTNYFGEHTLTVMQPVEVGRLFPIKPSRALEEEANRLFAKLHSRELSGACVGFYLKRGDVHTHILGEFVIRYNPDCNGTRVWEFYRVERHPNHR